jgi:hypothetical protein
MFFAKTVTQSLMRTVNVEQIEMKNYFALSITFSQIDNSIFFIYYILRFI